MEKYLQGARGGGIELKQKKIKYNRHCGRIMYCGVKTRLRCST